MLSTPDVGASAMKNAEAVGKATVLRTLTELDSAGVSALLEELDALGD